LIPPPLAGEGGENYNLLEIGYFHPHPDPPPSRGREVKDSIEIYD